MSLCIARSVSIDSQDGFYSPPGNLGKDFEYLIRRCIAEKMAREETESDAFGDDQSDATPEVASLDMPLDSENEADAKDDDVKAIEEVVETSKTIEEAEMRGTIGSVKYVAQLETSSRNGTNAPDNQLEERTMKCDNGASRNETAAETPTDDLFCEFEFPPLTRGTFHRFCVPETVVLKQLPLLP